MHGTPEAILTINLRSNFGRNGEHIWPESETCTQTTLDGDLMPICTGLVGLKNENVKISSASVRPKWAYKKQTHTSTT